ncbi:peptidylprolyl isomerase [Lyngbya confervoides]|uniref:peptidylprolyl isomerase n=1 Tax=Lyngbya confervoides BDU141951 TaxID=1574623 RepID=A0ABD4T4S5_9CYAN|nr:peptidylprolyl isomerase [Lyngbya confervoides]MCM1983594.1 peptidylprolyl isomerase [Lyngbya confervoides BDU141951]
MLQLKDPRPLDQLPDQWHAGNWELPEVTGDQILASLSRQGKMADWVAQAERSLLIHHICQVLEIEVSESELQRAGDAFRRSHGLESTVKTQAWLTQHQMSLEDWAASLYENLLTQKLQVALFGSSVDQHYLNHRHDYDRVALSQILVQEQALAEALRHQLVQDASAFCQLALEHSMRSDRFQTGGYLGVHYLKTLQPEVHDAIQQGQTGEILGPFHINHRYSLIKIEKKFPTHLSPDLRTEILENLLEEWLVELKNSKLKN